MPVNCLSFTSKEYLLFISNGLALGLKLRAIYSSTKIVPSFDAPEVSCCIRPPILQTSTSTSSIGSNCVVSDVCGPTNVSHGGWSKADDSIFIREVAHACALWERFQSQQQTSVLHKVKCVAGDPNPGGTVTSSDLTAAIM